MDFYIVLFMISIKYVASQENFVSCRDRSSFFRQDGGLCFEIPPWQHQPVELDEHIERVLAKWGPAESTADSRRQQINLLGLSNSEINQYIDTVIAPFLETYHRNIQNMYQLFASKVLKRIKDEITAAVKHKGSLFKELTRLALELEVPDHCDEERRLCRTVANSHVAQIYACTEKARISIAKMGKYIERMITITKNHMQKTTENIGKSINQTISVNQTKRSNIEDSLDSLSQAAVSLGYELDLSLTNARRQNEQCCESLTACCVKTRKNTLERVQELKDLLYQCVYT